jgi:hypothetical protein
LQSDILFARCCIALLAQYVHTHVTSSPMFARRLALLVLLVLLTVSGCVDDHQLLTQVHEYFPGAALYKFDKRVLWIQTQVEGVTPKFGEETFLHFLEEANNSTKQKSFGIINFSDALAHDGYIFLVLGFKQGIVVWDRRNVLGPNGLPTTYHWNLSWQQAPAWFTQHLGYYPQKDQITVVSD